MVSAHDGIIWCVRESHCWQPKSLSSVKFSSTPLPREPNQESNGLARQIEPAPDSKAQRGSDWWTWVQGLR